MDTIFNTYSSLENAVNGLPIYADDYDLYISILNLSDENLKVKLLEEILLGSISEDSENTITIQDFAETYGSDELYTIIKKHADSRKEMNDIVDVHGDDFFKYERTSDNAEKFDSFVWRKYEKDLRSIYKIFRYDDQATDIRSIVKSAVANKTNSIIEPFLENSIFLTDTLSLEVLDDYDLNYMTKKGLTEQEMKLLKLSIKRSIFKNNEEEEVTQ